MPMVFSLIVCGSTIGLVAEETLDLGRNIKATINAHGAIREVTSSSGALLGESKLGGRERGGNQFYQAAGGVLDNRAEVKSAPNSVSASGTLVYPKSKTDKSSVAEFQIVYTAEDKNTLRIHVEITYLTDEDWVEPLAFMVKVPVAQFLGGECVIETSKSGEKSYPIESEAANLKGYGAKKCTLSKGKGRISVEAMSGTQLSILDGRSFKGDFLRLDIGPEVVYAKSHAIAAGRKAVFEAKVIFNAE